MAGTSQPTDTPSQDNIDRVQGCQDLLVEIEAISKHREEQIERLAMCEGAMAERRRMMEKANDHKPHMADGDIRSTLADLDEYRTLVIRHLTATKALRVAYGELILDFLKNADSALLRCRRETFLAAFNSANDIDDLLMRRSEDILQPCERKRGLGHPPVSVNLRPTTLTQPIHPTVGRSRRGMMSTRSMIKPYARKGRTE